MNIEHYELYDFLMDESFRAWAADADSSETDDWALTLEAYPEKQQIARQAVLLIRSSQYRDLRFSAGEKQELWDDIRKNATANLMKPVQVTKRRWVPTGKWFLRAAAVVVPLLIGILWLRTASENREGVTAAPATRIEKQTQDGQKLQITFSDGTQVKLNADSKLTYTHPFASEQREVFLEGEAFFQVTPDPDRPFVVRTGRLSTRVLGTSFNIRTYPEEDAVQVAVVTGKVMVEQESAADTSQTVVLQPSEMATYDKRSLITQVTPADISRITAWNQDILEFNNARFEEVVEQLERWYGVKFRIMRTEAIKKGFDGRFQNKSLEHVLEGISYTSGFQYKIQGDTVFIH